jgi:ATP-dependent Lon protease
MSERDESLEFEELSVSDRPVVPDELPILPLRDTVLFPNSFMPLAVARESSVRLIDEAISTGKVIGVFTQRDASVEEPTKGDLYKVGTASQIHKMFKLPDGSLRLIVQGLSRLTLDEITDTRPYLRGRVTSAIESLAESDRLEIDALLRNIKRISSRSCRCRRCSRTTCRRWPPTSPNPAGCRTSLPRASPRLPPR